MNDERMIAHYDLDDLYVNAERLRDKRLLNRPVAIGGGGDRAIVTSCSPEARQFGIEPAMSIRLAKRTCPELTVIRGDQQHYDRYASLVTDIIADRTQRFERAGHHQFYADMSGMETHFGCLDYSNKLRKEITAETGLPVSFGLASNKLISKVANHYAKPNSHLQVVYGREKAFLAPKPIECLPLIGRETAKRLHKMGVHSVEQLSEMPLPYLENMFGKQGLEISRRANGIDDTPILEHSEQKHLSADHTFEQDTIDMELLCSTLTALTEQLAFELRDQGYLTGCVTVKLRYTTGDTFTKQTTISYVNSDDTLILNARQLFEKLYERRLLIRLIGIRFTNLVPGTYQISLFEDTEQKIRLYKAIDHIKRNQGAGMITRAITLPRV